MSVILSRVTKCPRGINPVTIFIFKRFIYVASFKASFSRLMYSYSAGLLARSASSREASGHPASEVFPTFHGFRQFFTAFITSCRWFLSRAELLQCTVCFDKLYLILFCRLCLCLRNSLNLLRYQFCMHHFLQ